MGRINLGRVVLGGIVAGVIINVVEYVLNVVVLADRWREVTAAHNLMPVGMHAILVFNIIGFIIGLAAVWTYAAIRPRFGEGPGTAFIAALLIWLVVDLVGDSYNAVVGLFPLSLTLILVAVSLVETVVATLVGAYLYKEE